MRADGTFPGVRIGFGERPFVTMPARPNPESRFDRDSWLVAAAAALYAGIALTLMSVGFRFPSDGWQYYELDNKRGLLAVDNLGAEDSPLRPGDIVVAVDGHSIRSLISSARPPGTAAGAEAPR